MSIEIGCYRTSLYTHPWAKASQSAIAGLRAARECRYSYRHSSKNVGKDADVAAWKAALRIDPDDRPGEDKGQFLRRSPLVALDYRAGPIDLIAGVLF